MKCKSIFFLKNYVQSIIYMLVIMEQNNTTLLTQRSSQSKLFITKINSHFQFIYVDFWLFLPL